MLIIDVTNSLKYLHNDNTYNIFVNYVQNNKHSFLILCGTWSPHDTNLSDMKNKTSKSEKS
jgi:hypothetical protein